MRKRFMVGALCAAAATLSVGMASASTAMAGSLFDKHDSAASKRATASSQAPQSGPCRRSQYGVHCVVYYRSGPGDTRRLVLGIRYNQNPGESIANQVRAENGWLDGTNDYSGRTWKGRLGQSADRRAFYLWRACAQEWTGRYVCTPWRN